MAEGVRRVAPAKINLALHVTGRRPDGYHELDTLAVFAGMGDTVTVAECQALDVSVSGRFARHVPAGDDNLAARAAQLLRSETGCRRGAHIRIEKRLPAGAGFGGGSADAAATLSALDALWGLGLGRSELMALAPRLGADVAMCLAGSPLRARGAGERIDDVPGLPELPLVLVWPGRQVSTAEAFGALRRRDNDPLPDLPDFAAGDAAGAAAWLQGCRNDLELPARRIVPEIGSVLQLLEATAGCRVARMSGSGAGCFGLYATQAEAAVAAARVRAAQPAWWTVATSAR